MRPGWHLPPAPPAPPPDPPDRPGRSWPQPWKRADGSVEPPRRQRGGAVPGPVVSRGLRVSHASPHIRELMAAATSVIIDYGKPYEDDFEFRPNPLTPKHFKCIGDEGFYDSYCGPTTVGEPTA